MPLFNSKIHRPANPAVQQRSEAPFFGVQTKLNIGKANDSFEQEADKVADQVVQKNNATPLFGDAPFIQPSTPPITRLKPESTPECESTSEHEGQSEVVDEKTIGTDVPNDEGGNGSAKIQRQCSDCGEELQNIQAKCDSCAEKEKLVQRKSSGEKGASDQLEKGLNASKGGGRALESGAQQEMESGFGKDFSGVRVHTDSQAVQMNKDLGAQAFTHENNIYFNEGKYQPNTQDGKHLLAHELTHTVQQGAAESKVQKKELFIQRKTAIEAVDIIEDRLQGYTSGWDSSDILSEFQGQGAGQINSILEELKSRYADNDTTREGMIDWLVEDMTAEDWRTLRTILIEAHVSDVNRIVALSIYDMLSGYTSAADSGQILNLFKQFGGTDIDNVLYRLELKSESDSDALREWLFSDLSSIDGERLRVHFLTSGGVKAQQYGAKYTAQKIYDLLSGYTSVSDSWSIVSNFERTPDPARNLVLYELNNLTGNEWGERGAADALMQDMSYDDYQKLRVMEGVTLPEYDYERGWLETAWDGFVWFLDWASMIVQWAVCGLAGIITGLLSVVWDIVVLVIDIVKAVWAILETVVYFISGGASGSEGWLEIKDFFRGLGHLFSAPGEVVSKAIEDITLEATLIEGPFEACQEAEFWVRKIVNVIVNIILIFAAGYGAVKGGATAVKTIVTVMRASGFRAGIVELSGMILRGGATMVAGLGDDVVRVIGALRTPAETMVVISERINTIRLAAADQGYWQFLRQQAGKSVAGEAEFWENQKAFWTESASAQEARLTELESQGARLMEDIDGNRVPDNADTIVDEIDQGTQALKDDVDDLHRRITEEGPDAAPHGDTDGPTTPRAEVDTLTVDTYRLHDGHEVKVLGDGRVFICTDPCEEIAALGGRVEAFQAAANTGLDSRKLADAVKYIAANGETSVDEFVRMVSAMRARGGEQATRMARLIDEIAAGGEAAASTSNFLERVARISEHPDIHFNLAELDDAFRRGDAIMDHGPLQSPIYMDKPHELIEGHLWQSPSGGNPAKQITNSWAGTVDFVIVDGPSGKQLILGRNHTGLSEGKAFVYGAGELRVTKSGEVVRITNLSGHYKPTGENLRRAYQWLIDNQYLVGGIPIQIF